MISFLRNLWRAGKGQMTIVLDDAAILRAVKRESLRAGEAVIPLSYTTDEERRNYIDRLLGKDWDNKEDSENDE